MSVKNPPVPPVLDAMDDPSLLASFVEADFDDAFDSGFENASDIPIDPFAFNAGLDIFFEDDAPDLSGDGHSPNDNYTPSIAEGDFLEPAQRFLFKSLKTRIRVACNVNSKPAERGQALEWIFVQGSKDADAIEFDPACRALGGRPVVMRARTMHQLWKANIMINEPLPDAAARPPHSLMSEISSLLGPGLPVEMAREIWYWPSIPGEALRSKFHELSQTAYEGTLLILESAGYIAIAFARIYFISRNPTIMGIAGRNRFEFAHSIYGDD